MTTADIIELIVLVLLLGISAFFSSAETALTTTNKIKMRSLAEGGNARAELVLKLTEDPGKMLSAILIGNNIVNLSASSLATSVTIRLFGNTAVGIATGILTFMILVFGEVAPKTMASIKAEQISLAYCHIIKFLMFILTPIILLINFCARGVLFLFRINPSDKGEAMTEEEFLTVVDVSKEEGVIEEEEHEIFHNIIDFGDTVAKDVMVPRVHVTFLDVNCTYDQIMEIYREDFYTRFPVYEETPDHIVGILNMKDMLLTDCSNQGVFCLRDVMRAAFFTYENKSTSELLMEMRKGSFHMAVVLDEYGELSGVLTLEDLLEEIVGEIHDEYDEEEEAPLLRVNDHEFRAEGSMNLEDFCEETGIFLESDCESLGGFIMEKLDDLPKLGDRVTTPEGICLTVTAMEDRRVSGVRIDLPACGQIDA